MITSGSITNLQLCAQTKICYNWIVLLIAALCLCHLGANKPAVFSMINTLHDMEHHIHSSFGDSAKLGSKKWNAPIAIIGQGNGVGPQIWEAVSTPLLEL